MTLRIVSPCAHCSYVTGPFALELDGSILAP
jgi:hypothetical protein